jgi:hypothetical protein
LIDHWYGTLVTVAVLVVLYLLRKLLLHGVATNGGAPGWRPELMAKFKQCHLGLNFSGQAPNTSSMI